MTRQKKELLRKLEQIDLFIEAEEELGCGFTPVEFYTKMQREKDAIYEALDELRKH